MARRLHPEERSLWNRVVQTVKPLHPVKVVLHPHPVEEAPKISVAEPKKPKPKAKPAAVAPQQKPVKTIEGNLDSHWDRRFNKGAVIPDISIDLHGQGLAGAHARLDHALEQAIHQRMRVVLLVTGKARAAIRRAVRMKEREEIAAIGRKLLEGIADRLPSKIGKKAVREAVKRLGLSSEEDLLVAIGTAKLDDRQVMEALVPGSTSGMDDPEHWPKQERAISIRGLTAGVAFHLGECCHPVPGDRIVGVRVPGKGVEVHAIDCMTLASGVDSDWLDLSWGERTTGAVARIRMVLHNRPGTMAEAAGIFASNRANIAALENSNRDELFSTYDADLEVTDLAHLTRILSALRASDAVAEAERL